MVAKEPQSFCGLMPSICLMDLKLINAWIVDALGSKM
jgi:hypothetical protein